MNSNCVSKSLIFLFLIIAATCQSLPVQAGWFTTYRDKMTSHELGTWDYLNKYENRHHLKIKRFIIARSKYIKYRDKNNHKWTAYYWRNLLGTMCGVIQSVTGFYGKIRSTKTSVIIPKSLRWRRNGMINLRDFSVKLRGYKLCKDIPMHLKGELEKIVIEYYKNRYYFLKRVNARKKIYGKKNWSSSISGEIPGLPLKFELINGQIKLKLSSSFLGMKFDGQIGPYSKYSGVKELIIISKNKGKWVYHIGNRPMSFEIPHSIVNFDGSTVTFHLQ